MKPVDSESGAEAEPDTPAGRGIANHGRLTRHGDTVERPRTPQSPLVQRYLAHLRDHGIGWVPEPLGLRPRTAPDAGGPGTEVLSWLPGRSASASGDDFPDDLLRSVAQHHLHLHQAGTDFEPPDGPWAETAGNYFPSTALDGPALVLGHNDLNPTNVLVGPDGAITGIIDWDYVRPVDPLFDIAVAMRHWSGLDRVARAEPATHEHDAISHDVKRRLRVLADAYRLEDQAVAKTRGYMVAFLRLARANVAAFAAAGRPGFVALIDAGYEATNTAMVTWLVNQDDAP